MYNSPGDHMVFMHHVFIGAAGIFQLKRPLTNKRKHTWATALDIAGLDAAALGRHSWL